MSYKFEKGKDLIIEAVAEQVKKRMKGGQAEFCAEFVHQFYETVALDDLQEWDIDDLYGAIVNFWSLIKQRAPNEAKIRIYNPDYERNHWQTTHTVIEINTEDMPFLVDSLRMVINRLNIVSHLIIHMGGLRLKRNKKNIVVGILPRKREEDVDIEEISTEAAILIEIDRLSDSSILESLQNNITRVLEDNRVVVEDWMVMRTKVRETISALDMISANLDNDEVVETKAFLNWIENHHFTFLGIRDYKIVHKGEETFLQPIADTGLGILRANISRTKARSLAAMPPEARGLTLSSRILVMSKTNTEATVHRQAYTDYIGVKRFNQIGEAIGELRIVGLYTSAAYNTNPKHIPFLRHKVALIMKNSHLNSRSHAGKVLLNILETLPRDDLIQANEDELLEIAMGIYHMQERRRIRMFARTDVYRRFVSCLVFVPKERFNTELRQLMQQILAKNFDSDEITFSTWFSESVLARIHFIIRTNPQNTTIWDFKKIEQQLIEAGRVWADDLQHFLMETVGEESANRLYARYKNAFPIAYTETFSPRIAVYDIKHIEALSLLQPLGMNFYKLMDEQSENFRLKIYQHDTTITLSDVLPIIEKLGMKAISERPYVLKFENGQETWVNDFTLQYTRETQPNLEEIKDLFQNAFASIWFGQAENDGFNLLVLSARINWREVAVLRTYAKYLKQIGFTFSQEYIESVLNNNANIAKKLIKLFIARFEPNLDGNREDICEKITNEILASLEEVNSLDEDKIIRQYIQIINATLRTNYYQFEVKGECKSYISVKLNSHAIHGLPKPYPMCEIFVYSPKFEGVHLRGGKVSRGGLRWSDRKEDFRTEILGLMKAQQVKNSIIVPTGAKGGFVPKQLPINGTREEILAEAINCYQLFIRGLLDITDNYKQGIVIKPVDVICFDNDDPYLVVAADKGTASFSDFANEISLAYNFWLGDAFASGGSAGYDHKKMGITAKGAWESVKRHFYEINRDIKTQDFTVVGIGDMAGDVFGNGMLLSKHIKLIAAFNHIHIFIDPNPDPELSFAERQRLFNLPRSNWSDYDTKCISPGGGVFSRNAKAILISQEMRKLFKLKQNVIEPNELIRILLTAEVDLLWSAGIGTFVKAEAESHHDVGDRSNDAIRVNASQLRCKVVGEGGNLGLTQLARIEYSLNNGLIYTDFIDNSAGVSCSDKEVNIKILLNSIVASGDLTEKQRNELLSSMTKEVMALVLKDNVYQPRAISLITSISATVVDMHARYINELERSGKFDRELEFLPSDKTLMEHKLINKGLASPSIAVLLSYSKISLKEQILASNVPEDPFFKELLISCFPKPLQERFSKQIQNHFLKREIIATRLSNLIVNEMGFVFVYRLQDETGAPVSAIVRAYIIARSVLGLEEILQQIEKLDNVVTANRQNELNMLYLRLLRRVTRWLLRSLRMRLSISKVIKHYGDGVKIFKQALPQALNNGSRAQYDGNFQRYIELGIAEELAHELTITRCLFSVLDIIDVSYETGMDIPKVTEVYFGIGEFLDLAWIRTQIISHATNSHWEALSREALRDDLDLQQRQLTSGVMSLPHKQQDFMQSFSVWSEQHISLIDRWHRVLNDLRSSTTLTYTMFFVAIRELLDLTQTTLQTQSKELA